MIKLVTRTLLLTLVLLLTPAPMISMAHVLETQGSVGAVLHINPADDPIAGQQANIFFDFKDKTNRFKSADCDCRLVVDRAGANIYDQPFTDPGGGDFTFPARDVYSVKAVGTPKAGATFDAFTLSYSVRVERGSDGATSSTNRASTASIIGLVTFGIVTAVGLFFVRRKIMSSIKNKTASNVR